ncbi:BrnA antitoxin family protein [Acidisphaera sp. S103]|uniref:BrnA antitoxin family protein n=1 Tax=Acidisphaera sp. S103 TaxID=1747223 RepID=UPI001C20512F|nr:BrnA antitoxin family protein [Acidisphaera sp. S103]
MNENDMKYHTSDGSVLTPAQIARLDEIEARLGESEDISEISEAAWVTAVRGKHYKAMVKDTIPTISLDPDVQAWLRAKGPGYQAEVNRILRERMLAEG